MTKLYKYYLTRNFIRVEVLFKKIIDKYRKKPSFSLFKLCQEIYEWN